MNLFSKMSILLKIDFCKTLLFNFNCFPIRQAMLFPVFVFRRTKIKSIGKIIPPQKGIRTGMIQIGGYGLGIQDSYYSRTIWDCQGEVIFRGKASIGRGCKICVNREGVLSFGDNIMITGRCEFICSLSMSFGDNSLLSWDILIMDTDFHKILNQAGKQVNAPLPVVIGNNVWIGCRSTILKGVCISDNSVVCANSTLIRHNFQDQNVLIGGHGRHCAVLKKEIVWAK